jgi:hypothetical protein
MSYSQVSDILGYGEKVNEISMGLMGTIKGYSWEGEDTIIICTFLDGKLENKILGDAKF